MATQKSTKSIKKAPVKAKSAKAVAPKKATPKPAVKAKSISRPTTAVKSKAKTTPAVKGKKAAPVSKKAAPAKPKPAVKAKPTAKTAPAKGKKANTTTKAKTVATPSKAAIKPALKTKTKTAKVVKPAAKRVVSTKPVVNTKAKPAAKPVAKVLPKASQAPKSVVVSKAGSASKTPPAAKPVVSPKAKAEPAKLKSKGLNPMSKTVVFSPKKKVAKPSAGKSSQPDKSSQSGGSKGTDQNGKPSVSTHVTSGKTEKSTTLTHKISKPIVATAAKQIEKMSEKKQIRPVGVSTATEEPQKTRYSDHELEEFDQLIDQKLIIAREQLEFYLKQLEDMAENPDNKIKSLDDGLSSLESERISSMAARQQKLIQHLENAKIRIKNKVYGICRETGRLISKERLRAVPHATLSIEAKQAQN